MYKKLFTVGAFFLGLTTLASAEDAVINKCVAKDQKTIVYTEFDCPDHYDSATEGWLSETNVTDANRFGDESLDYDSTGTAAQRLEQEPEPPQLPKPQ